MSGDGESRQLAEDLKAEADRLLNVDAQRALELADQICALDASADVRAMGLLTRADALRELGRHVEAIEAYEASAALYRAVGDDVGWARTRVGIPLPLRYAGAHSHVLADLDEARRILTQHKLWLRLARLENNRGLLLAGQGRSEDALTGHERALGAAQQLEPRNEVLEAEILFNLSVAHYQVDDHEQAEAFLKRAVSIFEREGQLEFVARASRNFARFAAGRGHFSKALATVLPGRRALLSTGRTDAAAHLGQVGVDCLIRLNRPAEAVELADQVVAEFDSSGSRVEGAHTHRLKSLALAQLGRPEDALAELACAEDLYGTAEWESGPANVRLGRAVVLGEMGRWAQALDEVRAVRDELQRRGLVASAAQADLIRGRALRNLGQSSAAEASARSALALVSDRPLPWLTYHAWRLLGDLARDAGDCPAALTAFLEAIKWLEHVQGRILTEYRASFLADKANVYESAVDLLLEQGDIERAFDLVERAKSRALVDALAGGLDIRVRATTPDQERLVDELNRLRREHDALVEQPEASAEQRDLELRITHLLEELRLAGADDLEQLSLLEGRVYSPQGQLGGATALVEFYLIGNDLVVFVLDDVSIRAMRVRDALPRLIRLQQGLELNLRGAAAAPGSRAALEPNARANLARLYDVLLRPVAGWIVAYDRLLIVPHGLLHLVPFGALHDGQSYLIERFELTVAPSASSLTFCLRPRARRSQRAWIGAYSANGALPGVIDEAKAVSALFDSVHVFENEFTVGRLRQGVREADLIHLAAHGVSRVDAPQFSYLQLADGRLTTLDCFDLDLDCALVTLSACESGRGVVVPGDEQIGLARAFLYAGARAVVHSLWRIDDRATQRMMTDFYTGLKTGLGRGAALRQAQLACLRSEAHPFAWAALELLGDWREESSK
jgi:tetratricopeptide (TPR) repeat protein